MSGAAPRPTEIKRIGRSEIRILWSDGHTSLYPNHHLRNRCPCALCRERPPHVLPVVVGGGEELHAVQIGVVGRYAISIQWSDGHDAGIYSYETLRSACPCCERSGDERRGGA
jgi:DUF971 family protein